MIAPRDPKPVELDEANQQLQQGLKACRDLVADLRNKLVIDGNEPPCAKTVPEEGSDEQLPR